MMPAARPGPVARWLFALLAAFATPVPALDLKEYPELRAFIDEVAERQGFSARTLTRLFAQVEIEPSVVAAIERPREALPYHEYRRSFLTDDHRRRGLDYWRRHEHALEEAQTRYGVPPEVVLGILGVETQYGRNRGRYRAIDSLTTLMLHHPPRAAFFRRELEELLLLARELKVDPLVIKGSYAGALGIAQFIPSSYRRYAVDFDGDGRRDLLGNDTDAIGSIANFLREHGWQPMEPVVAEARIEGSRFDWVEHLGVRPALTLNELMAYGIFPRQPLAPDSRAALVELEGEQGPQYVLALENFYVITRYNRSKRYAMAVHELSEQLKSARNEGPKP